MYHWQQARCVATWTVKDRVHDMAFVFGPMDFAMVGRFGVDLYRAQQGAGSVGKHGVWDVKRTRGHVKGERKGLGEMRCVG